jgi:16S rRNA processing protein RimM
LTTIFSSAGKKTHSHSDRPKRPKIERRTSAPSEKQADEGLLFPVGRIVGLQGLAGYMKVKPSSNNPTLLLDIETVQIVQPDGSARECVVEDIYLERRMLFLKLAECIDRTDAEKYVDCSISTTRAQLRNLAENEWWVDDLIGLAVFTTDGAEVGTVSDIIGANGELLEITRLDNNKKEPILVPFVEALVPVVDMQTRRIEVVNLPGLLD